MVSDAEGVAITTKARNDAGRNGDGWDEATAARPISDPRSALRSRSGILVLLRSSARILSICQGLYGPLASGCSVRIWPTRLTTVASTCSSNPASTRWFNTAVCGLQARSGRPTDLGVSGSANRRGTIALVPSTGQAIVACQIQGHAAEQAVLQPVSNGRLDVLLLSKNWQPRTCGEKPSSEYRLGWNNPPSAASSAAPAQTADDERAHEPQPFVVAINTSVSGGASPVIQGTTNLPDGTILWVRLWPPFPACFGHCEPVTVPTGSGHDDAVGGGVIVKSGEFIAGPAWQTDWPLGNGTGQLNPGRYILEVSFWAVEPDPSQQRQPASVKAVLGAHGEYMRGQLVGGCCFGYGSPGRAATQADAQKELGDAHAMSAFYGPGVYYARYVDVP